MTIRNWHGYIDSNMNDGSNYDGSGALLTTDDLVFNSSLLPTHNAYATADLKVGSVTTTGTYSIEFSMTGLDGTGHVLTLNDNTGFNLGGNTSTIDCGAGITLKGNSAPFYIPYPATMTITAGNCDLRFDGTTGCSLSLGNESGTLGVTFKSLTLGDGAKLTNVSGILIGMQLAPGPGQTALTLGNNSTFTFTPGAGSLWMYGDGTANIWSMGTDATFDGGSSILGGIIISTAAGGNITVPAINYTGSGKLGIYPSDGTISLSGDLAWPTDVFVLAYGSSFGTFNAAGFDMSAPNIVIGSWISSTSDLNFNAGASLIACDSVSTSGVNYDNNTININLNTSQWTVSNNWTYGTNTVTDPGTSLVTFNTTAATVVTLSDAMSFYDIIINNAAKAFSWATVTNIRLHNLTTTAMASYTQVSKVLTASGSVTFNGSGTLNLGIGITMTNSGTLLINSTVGTMTGVLCDIYCQNGTILLYIGKLPAGGLGKLTIGGTAIVDIDSALTVYFNDTTNPLTIENGGSLTITTAAHFRPNTNGGSFYSLPASYTLVNNSAIYFDPTTVTAGTLYAPVLTTTGTGWVLFDVVGLNNTISMTGTHTVTSWRCRGQAVGAIFNTNGNTITTGVLVVGATSGTGAVISMGASVITCTSIANATVGYDNAETTWALNKCQITCAGSITFGTLQTVTHQWDQITITGTSSITSNGESFNNLIIDASGKTITLQDNLVCHGYLNTAGTLNQNSKKFSILGDCQMVKIEQTGAV